MKYLKNEAEMTAFGKKLGALLEQNMVITLNGELGAGKTTLTKAIALSLDITDHIVSPTFTLVQEYEGQLPLYHFDAYRIGDEEEMFFIGFEEYLEKGGVCIIEWAEQIAGILPPERLDIRIDYHPDGGRLVELIPRGQTYENLKQYLDE